MKLMQSPEKGKIDYSHLDDEALEFLTIEGNDAALEEFIERRREDYRRDYEAMYGDTS